MNTEQCLSTLTASACASSRHNHANPVEIPLGILYPSVNMGMNPWYFDFSKLANSLLMSELFLNLVPSSRLIMSVSGAAKV